jgi:hypothetical protein
LRMVCGCLSRFDPRQSVDFHSKSGCELRASVGYGARWKPMEFPDVVPELLSRPFCCDSCVYRKKVSLFGERIYYHHDSVVAIRFQELNNEVYTYRMPSGVRRRQRLEVTGWQVFVGFCLQAEVTGSRVLAYVPRHLWPPIIAAHQFQCLPPTWMTGYPTIMVKSYDLLSYVGRRWNIDLTTEVEHSVFFRPLGRSNRLGGRGFQEFSGFGNRVL